MAKRQKTNHRLWIEIELINSKAFNSLTGYAPQLLFHLYRKRKFENHGTKKNAKWVCINHDELNITYIEFYTKHGITKPKMLRAKDQLLARGFIKTIHGGGGCNKDKAIYELINQWMFWQPGVVFEVRVKEKVQRGFCKPKTTYENVPIDCHENVP